MYGEEDFGATMIEYDISLNVEGLERIHVGRVHFGS